MRVLETIQGGLPIMLKPLSLAVAFGVGLAAAAGARAEDKPVRWKMASIVPSNLILIGTGGKRFEKIIDEISGGNIRIQYFEPGALVPPFQIFDAVSKGAVDIGWSGAGYWVGKVPAAAFFNSVPFGPGPVEYYAWLKFGGGQEIWDSLYKPHGLKAFPCTMIPAEASGWFKKEIKSLDDFKGMKLRYFGLGALVMSKLGASTQIVPTGETAAALERGVVDAAEVAMPTVDEQLGFHRFAKHYYFPGWHQQSSFLELLLNLKKWESLTARQKKLIETACGDTVLYTMVQGDSEQSAPLERLKAAGVTVHTWPPEMLAAMEKAWHEVAAAESAKDPDFKRTWESLQAFRKKFAVWNSIGYLKH
jgi:TRAP-type mannitol/chloroaromatic compound transport system substrate-binding protein